MTSPERLEKARMLRRLIALKAAEETFLGFVRLLHPDFKLQPFQLDLIEKLDRLERGALMQPASSTNPGHKVTRLLVTMPPRSGKSWMVSWLFPVWYIARRPARSILASSYNYELASDFGRRSRDYALTPEVGQAFPDFKLSESAADLWRTSQAGQYAGVGLQGTTTGRPANLLLVDDPIKNRIEADSPRTRNNAWSFYESALTTRREPLQTTKPDGTIFHEPAIEVVVLTRWHPDDMAGRLMESEEWKDGMWMHVNYPAITLVKDEKPLRRDRLSPDHPMYMDNAELPYSGKELFRGQMRRRFEKEAFYWPTHEVALWEERFPLTELRRRRQQNPREFASLYMQQPYIAGGNLFKEKWWKYYDNPPTRDEISSIVIGTDTAMMSGKSNDFSVLCPVALTVTGDMYVLEIIRGKWEFPDLKRQVLLANARYRGMGLRAFYIEEKNSGASLVQELKRETNVPVLPHKVVFDKRMRAELVTPLVESGLVYLPREALWLDEFLAEISVFDGKGNRHDDQVDALVIALDRLSKMPSMDAAMLATPLTTQGSLNSQADQILSRAGKGSLAATARDQDTEPHKPFIWGE